ncbi:MAG: metal-dependent amidase/aminoacylase/carboxypeptidase family protein [Natronomonas sp.]
MNFEGESAYSARPWEGKSAVKTMTLMQMNLNCMKETLPRDGHPSVPEVVSNGGQTLTTISRISSDGVRRLQRR